MSYYKKINLFETEEGLAIIKVLKLIDEDKAYNTEASYSANISRYPNNRISFVDKHVNYLATHPAVDPTNYIANLKLATRIRI